MDGFTGFLIVGALFIVRFALPVLVILLLGNLINRLYAYWDKQDQVLSKT